MKTNTEFKNEALAALKGNWAPAVLCTLVMIIIACIVEAPDVINSLVNPVSAAAGDAAAMLSAASGSAKYTLLSVLLSMLILMPIEVGFVNAFRKLLNSGDRALTENMFNIAFKGYWHKVWTMFVTGLFIVLWTFLLIIPGIIKAFSYAMTPFIIEDNPELSANDAIDRSRAMMRGHKFDLFWLYLSFIGWYILCILTLGIGLLWLGPYVQTATAAFYEEVKAEYEEKAVA